MILTGVCQSLLDGPGKQLIGGHLAHGHLEAQKVDTVDRLGALVHRVQSLLAVVLFHRVFADIARAPSIWIPNSLALRPYRDGQDLTMGVSRSSNSPDSSRCCSVWPSGCLQTVSWRRDTVPGNPRIGLLRQQHPPHIGLLDDWDLP